MDYVVVGLNHKSAPIDLRERLAFSDETLPDALKALVEPSEVSEGLILSTCNRVEVYAASQSVEAGIETIIDFLSHQKKLSRQKIHPHLYHFHSLDAVRHGFRVASSLDSLVVGETQIMGQVKKAMELAFMSQSTGPYLNRFMNQVFYVAKKVREETEISEGTVSIGSAATTMAKKIFSDLTHKRIVLWGAGEVAELVLTCLQSAGATEVAILNRTFERSKALAEKGLGSAHPLDQKDLLLPAADIIITSLGGQEPHLHPAEVEKMLSSRDGAPFFMIDLGVPRNIAPEVGMMDRVYLYNIDDLEGVVNSNRKKRDMEAERATAIVEKEASRFYHSVLTHPVIVNDLGLKFESIRKKEWERTKAKLAHLSADDLGHMEILTQSIVNKILHDPIMLLKSGESNERDWTAHDLLRKLFKLDEK